MLLECVRERKKVREGGVCFGVFVRGRRWQKEKVSRELTASSLRGERKRVGGRGMGYEINNCMMRADAGGGRVGAVCVPGGAADRS